MYASQTKRLCVRGAATSDESRVQHHSASSESVVAAASNSSPASSSSSTPIVPYQQQQSANQYPNQSLPQSSSPTCSPAVTALDRFGTTVASATVISSSASAARTAAAATAASPMTPRMTANDAARDNKQSTLNKNAAPQVSLLSSETTTTPTATTRATPAPTSQINNNTRLDAATVDGQKKCPADSIDPSDYLGPGNEQELIDKLANATLEEAQLCAILSLRNLITACNKKKETITNCPTFFKIVEKLDDEKTSSSVKTQLALLLCSIAKGSEHTIKKLTEHHVDEKIFRLINKAEDVDLIEASLRCMRSMMSWPRVSRTWILYENYKPRSQNRPDNCNNLSSSFAGYPLEVANLEKLINYCQNTDSLIIQECIADLFALTCSRSKDQVMLFKASPLPCILRLLESKSRRVVISSLYWLNQLCLKNHLVAAEVVKAKTKDDTPMLGKLTKMMNQDECLELQFLAAQCFVHIYRALATDDLKDDPRVHNNVLPTLVRMVHKDKPPYLRAKAAGCITYLIEHDTRLQNTASICDRFIESLAYMLSYEPNKVSEETAGYSPTSLEQGSTFWRTLTYCSHPYMTILPDSKHLDPLRSNTVNDAHLELCLEMRRAAFLALASLGSNLEPIRKKIFNTCSVMQHLVRNLNEGDSKTLIAVLSCLLSLSRSVQQLRTSFAENSVYTALKNLLSTSSNDVLVLVLAVLCNVSLDFSPGKQNFTDSKTVETLCNLTRSQEPFLRLHGMWILMNMIYQVKDLGLKTVILNTLGLNHVLELLETEDNDELVMKTLGFLRNLLSQRAHIDAMMTSHGDKILRALTRLLERKCSSRLKEQAVCVLTNIADGVESKGILINNRGALNYLAKILSDEQAGDLRLAAICCITNLALKENTGSEGRRDEMKKFGIDERLKALLETKDPILSDRVRTAYNQFMLDDRYVN